MKSFDEWIESQRDYDTIDGLEMSYARRGFRAGQQSRQDEVDELQNKINRVLVILDNFNCPQEYGVEEIWEAASILHVGQS